ncbi:MAG: RrF2 family transcriptional regulator [Chloroflexota bacterium]
MRINSKTRYATRALLELALQGDDQPTSLSQVAQAQQISLKYLESLFNTLRNAQLVQSTRGQQGGYRLAKASAKITLRDIYDIFEGQEAFVACIGDPAVCDRAVDCVAREAWCEFFTESMKVLERTTIANLVERTRERRQERVWDYAI